MTLSIASLLEPIKLLLSNALLTNSLALDFWIALPFKAVGNFLVSDNGEFASIDGVFKLLHSVR